MNAIVRVRTFESETKIYRFFISLPPTQNGTSVILRVMDTVSRKETSFHTGGCIKDTRIKA